MNTDYDDTKSLTLNDSIMFMAVTNPKSTDSLKVVLTATEVKSNKKITHNMVFKPIDLEHVPTIRDTTYELLQGNTIGCTGKCSFYDTFAYDLDEDEFDLYLLDEPEFGEFTFDAEKGQFTYVAPSDTFGEVYFSLYAIETNNPASISDTVKFKISVLDINDPPRKEDGTEREAWGTMCHGFCPEFDSYVLKGSKRKDDQWPTEQFTYWDLEKQGFRTFKAHRIVKILGVEIPNIIHSKDYVHE